MGAIEVIQPSYGIVLPGTGPAGVLTVFQCPTDRLNAMFFFFVAKGDGGQAFHCYYNCCFDNDTGAPVEVGTAVKSIFRGATAVDWDVIVEVNPGSATEVRIRGIGTAPDQVRWDIADGGQFLHVPPNIPV